MAALAGVIAIFPSKSGWASLTAWSCESQESFGFGFRLFVLLPCLVFGLFARGRRGVVRLLFIRDVPLLSFPIGEFFRVGRVRGLVELFVGGLEFIPVALEVLKDRRLWRYRPRYNWLGFRGLRRFCRLRFR